MTPLLVKMYDSQKLYELAQNKNPEARSELIGAVTQLMDLDLSDRENELLADVMITLIRQAEIELRCALAARLADIATVPLRLVLELANDEVAVAAPVLARSLVLNDDDLIYIIKSQGPAYWRAIAQRTVMSDRLINVLVDTREQDTVITLAQNNNIELPEQAQKIIGQLSCANDRIAKVFIKRDDITEEILKRIYAHVGEDLKAYIKQNCKVDDFDAVIKAVDETVGEFEVDVNAFDKYRPTEAMMYIARDYKKKDLLSLKIMIGALRRNQIQTFIAHFSEFTNLDIQTVIGILQQDSGQGLAIVCKACGVEKVDFVSIFLLSRKICHEDDAGTQARLAKALNYFDRISVAMAKDVMTGSLKDSL